jgi:hypothetical protein
MLVRRLRDERGIALVMALGITFVTSVVLISVIGFASANSRSTNWQNADQQAHALAEAGLNNALSVLHEAYKDGRHFFEPGQLLPPRTSTYDGRTVTWRGAYCLAGSPAQDPLCAPNDHGLWKIVSTGSVPNPTGPGAAPIRRTVSAGIPAVLPPSTPPGTELWNWVYSGLPAPDDTTCTMTIRNTVQVMSPLYVEGNLCIEQQVKIMEPGTGQDNRLVVGNRFFLKNDEHSYAGCVDPTAVPNPRYVTSCGSSPSHPLRLREAHILNGCVAAAALNLLHVPCRGPKTGPLDLLADGASRVFVRPGGFYTSLPNPPVRAPTVGNPDPALNIDADGVYKYSHPGPLHPCSVVSGTPPAFDSNAPFRDNSLPTVQNLTPPSSYTCRTVAGELSWNSETRVLTVKGPLFIDGSAKIEASGNVLASYTGRSALYVSGTFLVKNTDMCAVRNSANTGCDFDAWNPNEGSALAIAALGNGSLGGTQGQVPAGAGIQFVSSRFQGLVYAASNILIDTTSRVQGPMITPATIFPGQSGNISFPPITIVPTYTPGTPPPPARLGPVEGFGGTP